MAKKITFQHSDSDRAHIQQTLHNLHTQDCILCCAQQTPTSCQDCKTSEVRYHGLEVFMPALAATSYDRKATQDQQFVSL